MSTYLRTKMHFLCIPCNHKNMNERSQYLAQTVSAAPIKDSAKNIQGLKFIITVYFRKFIVVRLLQKHLN